MGVLAGIDDVLDAASTRNTLGCQYSHSREHYRQGDDERGFQGCLSVQMPILIDTQKLAHYILRLIVTACQNIGCLGINWVSSRGGGRVERADGKRSGRMSD